MFRVPSVKPVIADMWYDADARLWVELETARDETVRRADVYSPQGTLLFTATWPKEIRLGAVYHAAGRDAFGVRRIEGGVIQVVRLRFSPG